MPTFDFNIHNMSRSAVCFERATQFHFPSVEETIVITTSQRFLRGTQQIAHYLAVALMSTFTFGTHASALCFFFAVLFHMLMYPEQGRVEWSGQATKQRRVLCRHRKQKPVREQIRTGSKHFESVLVL